MWTVWPDVSDWPNWPGLAQGLAVYRSRSGSRTDRVRLAVSRTARLATATAPKRIPYAFRYVASLLSLSLLYLFPTWCALIRPARIRTANLFSVGVRFLLDSFITSGYKGYATSFHGRRYGRRRKWQYAARILSSQYSLGLHHRRGHSHGSPNVDVYRRWPVSAILLHTLGCCRGRSAPWFGCRSRRQSHSISCRCA